MKNIKKRLEKELDLLENPIRDIEIQLYEYRYVYSNEYKAELERKLQKLYDQYYKIYDQYIHIRECEKLNSQFKQLITL